MSARRPVSLVKRLTRHGNSLALVIDRPILDLLGIGAESQLSIRTDGRCLILTPVSGADRGERVRRSAARVHDRYAKALKRLAEE